MTGPELKARRKELGLKLQDVAHALGIKHIQQVSEWERGDVRPGSKHLVNLAKVLQVSISDLIATTCRRLRRQRSPAVARGAQVTDVILDINRLREERQHCALTPAP